MTGINVPELARHLAQFPNPEALAAAAAQHIVIRFTVRLDKAALLDDLDASGVPLPTALQVVAEVSRYVSDPHRLAALTGRDEVEGLIARSIDGTSFEVVTEQDLMSRRRPGVTPR